MKLIVLTGPVVKVLTVVGVVLAFVLVVYLMSGLPAPREQNRVGPADGSFSIIHPPDWETNLTYSPANRDFVTELLIRPIKSVGREQHIFAARYRQPPDPQKLKSAGFTRGQFQGQDALVYAGMKKYDYIWQAIFERGGNWYDLELSLTREDDVPHSQWWPYLNSFQAHQVPATEPGAGPASAPATLPTTMPIVVPQ